MIDLDDCEKQALVTAANAVADAARAAILPHFRVRDLDTENKDPDAFDPVTVADREAEAAMRAVLAELRPEDGIIGEEFGATAGRSGLTWVLDPIDGTRGFLSGTPTWGVLVAVGGEQGPVLGLIDQPYIGERFIGGLGLAQLDGPSGRRELRTRPARPLDRAVLYTTFPEIGSAAEARAFGALSQQMRLTRYGLDCYAYALVAAGQIDLVAECGLHSYDVQAPIAVIEAAGGVVTDWRGAPVHQGGQVLAAANLQIHAEALKILAPAAA